MIINPLHPVFAAELIGADLSQEPDRALIDTVEDAMAKYAVLVIRDCKISDAEHVRFSRAFGPLELPSRGGANATAPRRIADELFYAGNLNNDGEIMPYKSDALKVARGTERFHTDSSFHTLPTKWSALLGHETPPPEAGGDTCFIDTRAVYDELPQETKDRIDHLVGVHDFWRGRQKSGSVGEVTPEERRRFPFPPVEHPLVRLMPNGRKALYLGGHAAGIKGMEEPEADQLIEELYTFATQPKFIYRHHWRQYDLTIWDNRCTMHAATPLLSDAYRRDMRRTTINESGPETSAVQAMTEAGTALH
jgi:alpha-ketoglutarate-dependent 2,4-dichlorophenoxyacetate dioxygenase